MEPQPAPDTVEAIMALFGCGPGKTREILAIERGDQGDCVDIPDPFEAALADPRAARAGSDFGEPEVLDEPDGL